MSNLRRLLVRIARCGVCYRRFSLTYALVFFGSKNDMINLRIKIVPWYRLLWKFNEQNRNNWVVRQAARIESRLRVLDVDTDTGRYRNFFRTASIKPMISARPRA